MKRMVFLAAMLMLPAFQPSEAREYHVSPAGKDTNPGTTEAPFRTIQHGAELAQPGDTVTVHEGLYRERIDPPRGGTSEEKRIVYRAAPGEKVEIRGSEIVRNWTRVKGGVWKTVLPDGFFGDFNPFADLIRGDWFNPKKREHHTGAVYLDGEWLSEAPSLEALFSSAEKEKGVPYRFWYAKVGGGKTEVHADFGSIDPARSLVEVNVRRAVFYPSQPGRNYITVRGFVMCHAATPWAPPTAEQVGLLGTHWSRGWIIEDNTISHSMCTGITLGKYGDEFDNGGGSSSGYVGTIQRALKADWSRENIGHHLVCNNIISHCEQAGVVGSLGGAFSTITGNVIHDIHVRRLLGGAEMAGIKIHAPIDSEVSQNRIFRCSLGIWLDWMSQGTRVKGNLLYDNGKDLLMEMNHGPFLVANNILLSSEAIDNSSEGGAYVHNLIRGRIGLALPQSRRSPYHSPHSTKVVGIKHISGGDDRFINNVLFGGPGLPAYQKNDFSPRMEGNVLLGKSLPSHHEIEPVTVPDADPQIKLIEKDGSVTLELTWNSSWNGAKKRRLVTGEMLGKAVIPDLPFENPDGTPVVVDRDYFDTKRDEKMPFAGPFEGLREGRNILRVWPPGEQMGVRVPGVNQ